MLLLQLPTPGWKMSRFLAAEPRSVVLDEESAASSQGGVPSSLLRPFIHLLWYICPPEPEHQEGDLEQGWKDDGSNQCCVFNHPFLMVFGDFLFNQ